MYKKVEIIRITCDRQHPFDCWGTVDYELEEEDYILKDGWEEEGDKHKCPYCIMIDKRRSQSSSGENQ